MLVLTWAVAGGVHPKTSVLPVYRLAGRYRPVELWARVETAASGGTIELDVNNNGTSIFDNKVQVQSGTQELKRRSFKSTGQTFEKDSQITLDIDKGGGHDMTVSLYLEEV